MPTTLSKHIAQLNESPTAALMAKVTELRLQGEEIISLNIGEPDFPTPENIKEAGIRAIQNNFTKYTPVAGILPLRQAIIKKLSRDNHIEYQLNEVTVAVGAKQALASALMAVAGEGDEVIIPTPCYVSYPEMVKLACGTPVFVPLNQETYELDTKAIEEAINEHTKAVIICTPNNPTGIVYDEQSLKELGRIAIEHDLFVITDEIYEALVYEDTKFFSIASISKEMKDHTILVNGFSKTYAMTGWRLGYVAARADVIKAIMTIQSQTTTSPSSISQIAAVEALNGSQDTITSMVNAFEERMIYTRDRLRTMPGIKCPDVQGAFYVFIDISDYIGKRYKDFIINTDTDLCEYLLVTQHIACVPGSAYWQDHHIRISYSTSLEELKTAMDRFETALSLLK